MRAQTTTTGTVRPISFNLRCVSACSAQRTSIAGRANFDLRCVRPALVSGVCVCACLRRSTDQIGNEQLGAALEYAGYDSKLIIGTGWHNKIHGAHVFPDTLRWMRKFMPAYRAERNRLRLRLDHRFYTELMTPRRWNLEGPSPFEETRVNDPAPSKTILAEASANLRRLFPALKDVPIVETWAGLIDVTPDAVPVIAPVESLPGFHLATGFSGHGFGIGPGAGRLAAEMVTGRPTMVDLAPFRLERFFGA